MKKVLRLLKFLYGFLAVILSIGYIIGSFVEATLYLPDWSIGTRVAIAIICSLATIVFLIISIIHLLESNGKQQN